MENDEAITLILRTSDAQDPSNQAVRKAAEQVVLTLGCLALAIAQAGAVIRIGHCRIEEYPAIYSRRRRHLLQEKILQGNEGYEHTVYTTWEVSLRMIEDSSTEAGRDAIELLQMFSFFHFDRISEEILHQAWKNLQNNVYPEWISSRQPRIFHRQSFAESFSHPVRVALSILPSYSLISRDKDHLISIHPLVHAWTRDRMSRLEEERLWAHALSTLAFSVWWSFSTEDFQYRKCLVPHVDTCLVYQDDGIFHIPGLGQDLLRMADNFALLYREAGREQKALELREKIVKANEKMLGEENITTLSSMHKLAISYREVGQEQKALELAEKTMKLNKKRPNEEHPDIPWHMHNFAIIYNKVGQQQKALEWIDKVVKAEKQTLGEDLISLNSMQTLAIIYSNIGQQQEALELIKKVVKIRQKALSEEHRDTLDSMHNLALMYDEFDSQQKALELMEKVLKVRQRTLSEEHPDTLCSMRCLAFMYSNINQRQKALELMEKVVEIRQRTSSEEHPDTLRFMHELALMYSNIDQQQKALELIKKVMKVNKKTLNEEESEILYYMDNLVFIYSNIDQR